MMYGRDESKKIKCAVDQITFRSSTGTPFILDYQTRSVRPATLDDARVMSLLTDALDGFGMSSLLVSRSAVGIVFR